MDELERKLAEAEAHGWTLVAVPTNELRLLVDHSNTQEYLMCEARYRATLARAWALGPERATDADGFPWEQADEVPEWINDANRNATEWTRFSATWRGSPSGGEAH